MIRALLTVSERRKLPFFGAESSQFFSQNDGRILPVKLHGTRSWHLASEENYWFSNKREAPRRKAVASCEWLVSRKREVLRRKAVAS